MQPFLIFLIPTTTGQQFNCTHDISLNDVSCINRYRDNRCGENWLYGYCCITCGYESCLNKCYTGSISNFPAKPFNCDSDIPQIHVHVWNRIHINIVEKYGCMDISVNHV